MIKWRSKKEDKLDFGSLDPVKFKIGSILDWTRRAEYYHVNWVRENVGPFKATSKLVNALEIEPDDFVLDVACGTGAASVEILNRLTGSGMLVGIDLSRTALSIAKSWVSSSYSLSNSLFIQMDAENMGFKSIFTKIACQYALGFFPDPKKALREVIRAMKSHGRLGVVVHGRAENVPYLGAISDPLSKYMPDIFSKVLQPVYRFGKSEDLREVLIDAGFSDVSISKFSFKYRVGSFESYWSDYFLNGYGNTLRPIIFTTKNKTTISKIKSDAKEIASRYDRDGTIEFPWEVIIAIAYL